MNRVFFSVLAVVLSACILLSFRPFRPVNDPPASSHPSKASRPTIKNRQASAPRPPHEFTFGDQTFLLDGKPFQIISGEMHYTRIPREAWRDRMKMAKAMGLNTIGTYVFWNTSEPEKGVFDFTGNNDVAAFVKMAQEEGLWVVLRPSPYVCAEWEFGGYPYWLQNEKGLVVRSREAQYLKEYKAYIDEVGKQLASLQINHGGNILMVQIENEYGSYGNDKAYLDINRQMFIDAGFDGLLFTCDPAKDVTDGHLPGLLPAVNGLDDPSRVKDTVDKYYEKGKGPYYISEWYPAWFDWWGTAHHTVPASNYAKRLDNVLGAGISINMYMFHGGTTRGFMTGANYNDHSPYEPQVSSYDYDAPLDEAGNPTPKFMAFREVIEKHLPEGTKLPAVPATKPSIAISDITFTSSAPLLTRLPQPIHADTPMTFEALHQAYGFVLYRTKLNNPAPAGTLSIEGLRDYALIFVNGKRYGTLDRRLAQTHLRLPAIPKGATLDILVENLGRVNFGPYLLKNNKGIVGKVTLNHATLKGWNMYSLPFSTTPSVLASTTKSSPGVPVLKKATFSLSRTGDTYLDMRGWGKGMVWVNGHNLGRYWKVGPQQTIYLPAEWQRRGSNSIVVLELLKAQDTLHSVAKPILDEVNIAVDTTIPKDYKLVWSDEFNKDGSPDPTNWTYEHGFERNHEDQWYQPENAHCANGLLVIEARKEQKPNPNYVADSKDWRKNRANIQYTSTCLKSVGLQTWTYGRFEMRGRIDIDPGCWPAWWTLGVDRPWPANGEIDIMEYYRDRLLSNFVSQGPNNQQHWSSKYRSVAAMGGKDWAAQFHTWRMDWDSSDITLSVDGILWNKISVADFVDKDGSGFEPFKQPHYMLLNLAIGGDNGGDPAKTSFPRRFEVDYVRVYQKQ